MTEAYPHWHGATLNIASPPREDYNPSQLTPATLAAFVKIPLRELWYLFLLSNWIEYKYPAILYGYLDSWLFFTVKKTCKTSWLRALRFSIHFAFPALWEMSRKTWQKKKAVG